MIERIDVRCYRIPTDGPEADGTLAWDHTTLVTVFAYGEGKTGFGYTYSHRAAAVIIRDTLAELVIGCDPMDTSRSWKRMLHGVRNLGRHGIVATAIAAVDSALWDLKAQILDLPMVKLLGAVRDGIAVYGSGGFTSYDLGRLRSQTQGWSDQGIKMVKMKIGTHPNEDFDRVRAVREAIGQSSELFVDANGAYDSKQALSFADSFSDFGVTWFEEPVSSDDLEGLAFLKSRAPGGMRITAGEYGYDSFYFKRMLDADAVDVLQADATRCMGITGFLRAAALCDAKGIPFSAHTAPTIHLHPCCATERTINLEYFYDHSRIEHMLFDGAVAPKDSVLYPDLSRPGFGVEFKMKDAEKYEC